ncbi:Exosome complex component RRP40 [Aphelenchoides besseyi]|nr:Exosome complex component RRP40 [Aphelenchoides besseyi]
MAVVLPNDEIPALWLINTDPGKKKQKTVSAGLDITADRTLVARVAGILHETEHKIWIESAETRYIPKSGDFVLGTVTTQVGDFYRVDIGGPQQAMLSFLNFEGATKRNKPNIKTGSLIYGQVFLASKNMEPELTCVDNDQRAQGMGLIQTPGTVIQIPLSAARRLLKPNNKLISTLGEHLKFELVVGMNGHVMITGAPRTVVAIQKAILQSINTFEANYEKLVESLLDDALTTPVET